MGSGLAAVDLGTGVTATSLAAGSDHTCAALGDGSLKVRGWAGGTTECGQPAQGFYLLLIAERGLGWESLLKNPVRPCLPRARIVAGWRFRR